MGSLAMNGLTKVQTRKKQILYIGGTDVQIATMQCQIARYYTQDLRIQW